MKWNNFIADDGEGGVLRLEKTLYGLRQSGRAFQQLLNRNLRQMGWLPATQEECIWTRKFADGSVGMLCSWVDDLLIYFSRKGKHKDDFMAEMSSRFKLSEGSGNQVRQFLGMQIIHHPNGCISLRNPQGIRDMMQEFAQGSVACPAGIRAKSVATPMVEGRLAPAEQDEQAIPPEVFDYRKAIGMCLHLARTFRPDCQLAVSELSQFLNKPVERHIRAAKRLIQYLYCTADDGITYHPQPPGTRNKISTFVDADWLGETSTCKSRSGFFVMLNGAVIDWFTRKQTLTALSSCESETYACVLAAASTLHFRELLHELFATQPGSTVVFTDNRATLVNSSNDGQSKRSRHFQLRIEFLRDYVRLGRIRVEKVSTDENIADALTKSLGGSKFLKFKHIYMGYNDFNGTDLMMSTSVGTTGQAAEAAENSEGAVTIMDPMMSTSVGTTDQAAEAAKDSVSAVTHQH